MKRLSLSTLLVCATFVTVPAIADQSADREKLIALDKSWGAKMDTATLEQLLDPRLIAISPDGVVNRAQQIASETGPNAADGPYEPSDYHVTFINDELAIMVHSTQGADPHYSMHLWEHEGDKWRVVASASTPVSR
ncbi:nuclear transport factor 2 family protein [Parahaliea sp. F7430]|uniref:Nuclear transport factor 2 family protein n=1 Tax=Sediminihaliea albiluteola TaxID=2758564 RepID=A0A7W2YJU3_9GAMM|nr:nuclear transport factor 2 family protein [Sediminihaliea albiluteola]MBA6412653.1 nuclear transport factor 2 family protein [Sediminihaliea albiluteola]